MVNVAARQPVAGAALNINRVSHGFDLESGRLKVLEDVSLTVAPGEFVAFLGPSGCGKSTLLRLVAGLEVPDSGRISADGAEIRKPDPSRVVVFQDPTLYPWRTVRQNVELGLQLRRLLKSERHRVDAALRKVGLEEFADVFPHQLSGGMAQRASLARALVNDPEILILDEPLGKLDSLTRIAMQTELIDLWRERGFTALLVTHDVEEAFFLAQRVVVFSPRPARVLREYRNDLPYPRRRGDPALAEFRRAALADLGLDASW
ncbi:ABC transporter ATP-binding protein [Paenirhodobacter sp.]|uniref:ABC transporter ATP-binding protein n=1 Tax=Paenirhodobacter sp. TaxID=1965326 RepID=UPI003B3E4819